jgi:hypothetical protein
MTIGQPSPNQRPEARIHTPLPARGTVPVIVSQRSRPADDIRADWISAERLENHLRSKLSIALPTTTGSAGVDPRKRRAIAGDYVTAVRASARGESASTNFRVTVTTSTMWGIAGVGIIGVALLVMVGAVARFGRR